MMYQDSLEPAAIQFMIIYPQQIFTSPVTVVTFWKITHMHICNF